MMNGEQCNASERGCWYCWHHYFVLSLLTSSREPKRKTFHSSGLCGSPREFLCPSSCFQLRPSCRWVLFVSNQPGWVKRDHEKLRSKSILIFLEASPPHLHLHFSAPRYSHNYVLLVPMDDSLEWVKIIIISLALAYITVRLCKLSSCSNFLFPLLLLPAVQVTPQRRTLSPKSSAS